MGAWHLAARLKPFVTHDDNSWATWTDADPCSGRTVISSFGVTRLRTSSVAANSRRLHRPTRVAGGVARAGGLIDLVHFASSRIDCGGQTSPVNSDVQPASVMTPGSGNGDSLCAFGGAPRCRPFTGCAAINPKPLTRATAAHVRLTAASDYDVYIFAKMFTMRRNSGTGVALGSNRRESSTTVPIWPD